MFFYQIGVKSYRWIINRDNYNERCLRDRIFQYTQEWWFTLRLKFMTYRATLFFDGRRRQKQSVLPFPIGAPDCLKWGLCRKSSEFRLKLLDLPPAIASSQSGTSCCESRSILHRSDACWSSLPRSRNVMERPRWPLRPVRPILRTCFKFVQSPAPFIPWSTLL